MHKAIPIKIGLAIFNGEFTDWMRKPFVPKQMNDMLSRADWWQYL